jgi:hypothetical protein
MTMNQPFPSSAQLPGAAPSYFLAALSNQYNLILLAGSAAFAAALASWAPLLSGLVGEALWLVTGPRLSAFRRHTDALQQSALPAAAPTALPAPQVQPEYTERVAAADSALRRVEEICATRSDLTAADRAEVRRRLAALLPTFVEVCGTHHRLRRAALQVPLADLQTELASLHQALAAETDLGVRASLRRGFTVAERRIKQLESNEAACRSIELGLQNFLQSLALLAEAAAGLSTAAELGTEIESAASQLQRQGAAEVERELSMTRSSVLPPGPAN